MKKLLYILFTASAVLFVSCAKEVDDNITAPEAKLTGETITFSATIDMPAATRAALDGLNINWQSGDYVAFATDNDATIRVYPVTVDGVDPTKCTITVDKVDGASGYYAIFKGSLGDGGAGVNSVDADDYSMVTFNTTTKTFSGLTVGNQQVAKNSLSSYLWYTDGYPLAMAGKADGSSLSMKPCLALVKLQIDAESVPAGYYYTTDTYTSSYSINHDHNYSAVRGFNLYQIGGSTIYSSGDYDVQIAADGSLTTTATGDKQYRQISQSDKLTSGTDYLMCLIPGGSISSFKIDFLGYKDNTPSLSWDAVYAMRLAAANTVAPGDYYDLGVLNPLGRKKAKNEAEDEAADAAAGIANVVDIDGVFDDWDGVTEYPGTRTSGSSNSRINGWRMTQDVHNIYVYLDLAKEKFAGGGSYNKPNSYIYVCLDTEDGGSTRTSIPGVDKYVLIYPCVQDSDPVTFIQGADPRSQVNGSSDGAIETWGIFGTGANESHAYIELSIPRAKLNLTTSNQTIQIGVSFQEYDAAKQSITLD